MRSIFSCLPVFIFCAINLNAQISGTYTIGGTNPDFSSINSAIDSLITEGVSGPVTFNIRNGTYNEQIFIPAIQGASSDTRIILQSEAEDSFMVIIAFAPDSINNNVVEFNNASYITLKHLTLQILPTSYTISTNYTNVLEMSNGSCNNQILNCRFIGIINSSIGLPNNGKLLYSKNNSTDSANVIMNNLFLYGNEGINMEGNSGNIESGNMAVNNKLYNQSSYGIRFVSQKNLLIKNNRISAFKIINIVNFSWFGLAVGTSYEDVVVCYNKIFFTDDSVPNSSFVGLNITNNINFQNTGTIIFNNIININILDNYEEEKVPIGINLFSVKNVHLYNNSVKVGGNGANMHAIWIHSSYMNKIKNNIFANFNPHDSSTAIRIIGDPSSYPNEIDYNCIYSASPYLVFRQNPPPYLYLETLTEWQALTGYDSSSISADPLFTDSLLHVSPYSPVCARGTFLPEVTEDIEGNLRKNPPTIGAYEIDSCVVGISEMMNNKAEDWFSVYPNPANAELNILINAQKFSGKVEIEIFSINGQKVIGLNFAKLNQSYLFDISILGGGIYYCTVKSGENYSVKRFVIIK